MACLLAPAVEAAIVAVAAKIVEKKEKKTKTVSVSLDGTSVEKVNKIPFSRKLKWLSKLQFGGALLLLFEHVWHGEIVPFFPFLTAMSSPEDTSEMLHEIATVGVTMAILTTVVWVGMLAVSSIIEKRAEKEAKQLESAE